MAKIAATRKDVLWNYVGTISSMAGNFFLLPLLLVFLSADEVGLWYVFTAVAALTQLFEFGFNPTFARNIVYCMSGARKLTSQGFDPSSVKEGVDWHLLRRVLKACRAIYAIISCVVLFLVATIGSCYVAYVARDMQNVSYWIAWGIFCLSIFVNLYFLYQITFLRGLGDVAAENKSKTFARALQLAISAALLFCGAGIVGASAGFFLYGFFMRLIAGKYFKRHLEVVEGVKSVSGKLKFGEIFDIIRTVWFVAWRDGVVQLSSYVATQASSIICSIYLPLSVTGTYSILLQFATAIYLLAGAFGKSHLPMFQSAYASGDKDLLRRIVERSISAYWILFFVGVAGVAIVVMPMLPLFKPGISYDLPLLIGLSVYLGLWNQHSLFCNFIVCTNRIPYVVGYVVSSFIGIFLTLLLVGYAEMGVWGLVLGSALPQAVYNNWKWPHYIMVELGYSWIRMMQRGLRYWVKSVKYASRK